ncbi:MAG: aryl-sulfate sulfotransferase [Clostridiales bacterium]|nr:aryl-sulfate sulfotransferase [Clostridiales bacterium]
MKKRVLQIFITSMVMIAALGGLSFYLYGKGQRILKEERKQAAKELDIISEDSPKVDFEEVKVTSIDNSSSKYSPEVVYNETYSQGKTKEMEKKKRKNVYNFESPLWQWNLYGTNNLSMYLYFKTGENVSIRYTIQVEDEEIPNFTRTLYNGEKDNVTREHSYQLIGFIPGKKNYIILDMYNPSGKLLNQKIFSIDVPVLASKAKSKIDVKVGKSEEQISNGLYTIYSDKYIWMYDNSGYLRGEIPLIGTTSQKIMFYEDNLFYGVSGNQFILVNKLGQVMDHYSIGKYEQYVDYLYNGYGQLWILATKPNKKSKSIKDTVIALDMDSKQVTELFSMEDLLKKMEKKAKKPKKAKKLDWITLNAIEQVGSDGILLSSRELSTIIKVEKVNSREPRISYMIGEEEIWKGTNYKKKLLKKSGQEEADEEQAAEQASSVLDLGEAEDVFFSHVGQSYMKYETSGELSEGQYYLYVWNSNYGEWNTNKKFKWNVFSNIGTEKKDAEYSYIKKYLIDENANTFNLEEEQEVEYTKKNGSMQYYKEHRIDNYGSRKEFAEYDSKDRLLRKFSHSVKNVLRVEKQDMKGFWFYLGSE